MISVEFDGSLKHKSEDQIHLFKTKTLHRIFKFLSEQNCLSNIFFRLFT
jgi:hypothetical protein